MTGLEGPNSFEISTNLVNRTSSALNGHLP
jgi:hypothetical protein